MSGRVQTIVHPTDFSDTSAVAFAHALRISLAMRGLLYLVHIAESDSPDEYDGFPRVRHVLARWGLMNENDPPEAVGKLDSILRNVKQDDSNNEVDSTPTMKSLRQAAASNSTIFWIALSAR